MYQEREDKIAAYLSGNMPEQECALFLEALDSDLNLKEDFEVYKKIWELTNQLNHSKDTTQSEWNELQKQVSKPVKTLSLDWLKLTASISILAVISVSMWFFGSTDISLTTQQNGIEERLADNSNVQLHYNSLLVYGDDFNKKERKVELKGAAYFDISKSDKPFIVETENGNVTVYGTKFTVFSNNSTLMVELHEGSVGVDINGVSQSLVPGQRLYSDGEGASLSDFNTASSWSDDLELTDVPLVYIIDQLVLTYNISSELSGKWLKESYTVSLPKNNLTACLAILNDVVGKNIVLKNQTIVLN
jgi:ferric-dicitrate binding protein FerR (iron transport regulator)